MRKKHDRVVIRRWFLVCVVTAMCATWMAYRSAWSQENPKWTRQDQEEDLRERFPQWFSVRTPEQKRAVVGMLLHTAEDETYRFDIDALLHDAADLSASLGDFETARQAMAQLARFYRYHEGDSDAIALKTVWATTQKSRGSEERAASDALDVIDLCVSCDNWDHLHDAIEVGQEASHMSGSRTLESMLSQRASEALEVEKQYRKLAFDHGTLVTGGTTEEMAALGRYIAFDQRNMHGSFDWLEKAGPQWAQALKYTAPNVTPTALDFDGEDFRGAMLLWKLADQEKGTARAILRGEAAGSFSRIAEDDKYYSKAREFMKRAITESPIPIGALPIFWDEGSNDGDHIGMGYSVLYANERWNVYTHFGTTELLVRKLYPGEVDTGKCFLCFGAVELKGDCVITSDFRGATSVGLADPAGNRDASMPLPDDNCWHRITLTRKGGEITCKIDDDAPAHVADGWTSPAYFMLHSNLDHRIEIRNFGVKLPEEKK
jgi:hypothetical protein